MGSVPVAGFLGFGVRSPAPSGRLAGLAPLFWSPLGFGFGLLWAGRPRPRGWSSAVLAAPRSRLCLPSFLPWPLSGSGLRPLRPPGWPRPVVLVAFGVWVWGAVGWPPSSARVELGCAGGSPLCSGTFLDRTFYIIGTGTAGARAALPADEEQRVRERDAPRRRRTAGARAAAPRRGSG